MHDIENPIKKIWGSVMMFLTVAFGAASYHLYHSIFWALVHGLCWPLWIAWKMGVHYLAPWVEKL